MSPNRSPSNTNVNLSHVRPLKPGQEVVPQRSKVMHNLPTFPLYQAPSEEEIESPSPTAPKP